MAYDIKKQREESWKREYPVFKEWQEKISAEKLNQYGFDVLIQNPRERRLKQNHLSCGCGFEHAHIYFKGIVVATIHSQFNTHFSGKTEIEYLWIRNHWKGILDEVNVSRVEIKLPQLEFKRDGHQTLQSCLDEMEQLRREISHHFFSPSTQGGKLAKSDKMKSLIAPSLEKRIEFANGLRQQNRKIPTAAILAAMYWMQAEMINLNTK